ncbi:hypothetical protein [Azomonas macrocytogenes]|uniref:Uncharacterized protein n=1 Tax=Azomonas macrocytogenes TaxID=69962 RepID=A0A839T4A1_AZOMA|nr:hypothetical protein [Azomonas macrocytogenes]MBB3104367.1 hypothetical protein [Azomonas macrocytogenes]
MPFFVNGLFMVQSTKAIDFKMDVDTHSCVSVIPLLGLIKRLPNPDMGAAMRDLFSLGCLLIIEGQTQRGFKACNTVFETLGPVGNTGYFEQLLQALPTQAAKFVSEIKPSESFAKLLRIPEQHQKAMLDSLAAKPLSSSAG